jgi:hypothetical protein
MYSTKTAENEKKSQDSNKCTAVEINRKETPE